MSHAPDTAGDHVRALLVMCVMHQARRVTGHPLGW
jgi:hypothetical protein